jgi:hypothetical protein
MEGEVMRNAKLVVGLVLMVAAVAAFTFWESDGRNMVYEKDIVTAAADINQGDILTEENTVVKGIGKDYIVNGAAADPADVLGKRAMQYIPEGSQISDDFLTGEDNIVLKPDESIYCIDESMISMVSSSLRRGDRVHIYGGAGKEDLGSYTVAFVKDSADREVKNAEVLKNDVPLDRESSNYTISRIEIVCTRDDYASLSEYVSLADNRLTIVQEV